MVFTISITFEANGMSELVELDLPKLACATYIYNLQRNITIGKNCRRFEFKKYESQIFETVLE